MKIAIYPGSFDPITNGHLDILKRSLEIFDHVIVLLAINPYKTTTFSVEDRLKMIEASVKEFGNHVTVDSTGGLTVRYAREHGACALVRGLRAVPDFEYESQIAAGNEFIDSGIEMVFFMSRAQATFISSSTIKQLAEQKIDIAKLVHPFVNRFLIDYYHR
ncbi:MAG TPA: pantetheine-phosphate adenylyltransferase [Firmicutes bacterium]|jgi:pantetheine-phosphate adenylyltransferase|nr:pantetheine-phosphate adenylyltransferase [Bacillota bacterium]HAV19952.1 pantetheine-phosphate adenylyltransferase [Bacillota bacterium]